MHMSSCPDVLLSSSSTLTVSSLGQVATLERVSQEIFVVVSDDLGEYWIDSSIIIVYFQY